jgi:hypothetical protein
MRWLLFLGFIIIRIFIFITRPLSLGILVIFTSLVLTIILGMRVRSWWGMILFLIYVGALLVLFVYVIAISPNCFFSRPDKLNTVNFTIASLTTLRFMLISLLPNTELICFNLSFLKIPKPLLLDSYYNISCLISLRLVLLVAMVAVVYLIPGKNQGAPLRPFR